MSSDRCGPIKRSRLYFTNCPITKTFNLVIQIVLFRYLIGSSLSPKYLKYSLLNNDMMTDQKFVNGFMKLDAMFILGSNTILSSILYGFDFRFRIINQISRILYSSHIFSISSNNVYLKLWPFKVYNFCHLWSRIHNVFEKLKRRLVFPGKFLCVYECKNLGNYANIFI